MRVGLIADVHGNVPALDAVLAELERERVDRIVCLGDVAVGPEPRESLARVRSLGSPVVLGNWDAAFVDGLPSPAGDEVSQLVHEIHGWWGEQLDDDDRSYLRTFVPQLELDLDGLRALVYHGSPRSYDDWIFATTTEDELEEMFPPSRPALLIGGHTHVQLLRRWNGSTVVNPGSVGLPFLEWWPRRVRIAPWAEYAILTAEAGQLHVDLRRTRFDLDRLLRLSRGSGMPHAEWWADCWVPEAA
jgi:predicted phosphodiesterase